MFFFKKTNFFLDKNDTFNKKVKAFILALFFLFIVILIWSLLLKIIDNIYIKTHNYSLIESLKLKQKNRIFNQNSYINIIRVILIAPVLEELVYRFPLSFKKNSVIVSLVTFCAIYIGDNILSLSLYSYGTWSKISAILFILLYAHFFIKQSFLNKIKNNFFSVIFYLLAILFVLDHTSLYVKNLPSELLILVPLFIIPQFFLAITASYLRLKNGIIWAILLHILFNTPTVLNYIFSN